MKTIVKTFVMFTTLVSVTPSFAASSSVPFSPYIDMTINNQWDSTYEDMEPMDLVAVSEKSGIKNYHLAFITDSDRCNAAWGSQAPYSVSKGWGSHVTDKLRANNIDFVIALGGASGNDLSLACQNADLIATYEQIIKTYQPSGLDFDIENGTANVANIMTALQQVQRDYPKIKISFTLPVLPDGLTDPDKNIVKQAQAAGLNFSVNIMAMDYGPAFSNDMGQYAIQAATNLYVFLKTLYPFKTDAELWQMIEVTPMIGVNDVNVEEFTLTNVDTLHHFAEQNHLGGLSMWSIARDNPCSDKWASPICSGHNLQTKPYEFSQRFLSVM